MRKLKKILLVDDDKINNYLNENLLKDLQITDSISIEMNGELALKHLKDNCDLKVGDCICPEIVIFDHYMPVMDGLELIQALKEINFIDRHKVVFILLGINSNAEDIAVFQNLGVQEFTLKPLSTEVVMDAYHKYFVGDTKTSRPFLRLLRNACSPASLLS